MKKFHLEERKGMLILSQTLGGRLHESLWTFAIFSLGLGTILLLFYSPEFFRESREPEGFNDFLLRLVLGFAFTLSFILGLMRFFVQTRWTFDTKRRTLGFWTRTIFGRVAEYEVPLKAVREIRLRRGKGLGVTSILIDLHETPPVTLAKARGAAEELQAIFDQLSPLVPSPRAPKHEPRFG